MKYFIIRADDNNAFPVIYNWYHIVKKDYIQIGKSHLLPKWILLPIKGPSQIFFPDIITHPFFLVSDNIKGIIELYVPELEWKRVILYSNKNEQEQLYFLPILEKVSCLSEESKCSPDKSQLVYGILQKEKIKDRILFQLGDVTDSYIIMRMDLLESILRRGASCLSLEEISVIRRAVNGYVDNF